ncbi:unnamed protein product [Mytilus coruscus]|uniref:Uncharacterized protein n=1 Tax=Mytilus coruscus TaxID=42192 RepID=A0A6J8B778_MYTCO|nr:unnamed protein product [Mytilus coruscus]
MSESSPRLELNEDLLLAGDIPQPKIPTAADKSSDLVDTVELFKTILDSKLGELKSELIQQQDSLKRKIKEDVTLKFKGEETVNKLSKFIPSSNTQAYRLVLILQISLKAVIKKIRIADSSPAGWGTAKEYEPNAVASDSEDEERYAKLRPELSVPLRRSPNLASNLTLRIRLVNNLQNLMVTLLMLSIINVLSSRPFVGASQGVSLLTRHAFTASSKATGERTVLFSPASGHPTATPQPTRSRKKSLHFTLQPS